MSGEELRVRIMQSPMEKGGEGWMYANRLLVLNEMRLCRAVCVLPHL